MSTMHGPRKDKKYRDQNYRTFFKFAIALAVMIVLCTIANLSGAAG